MQIIKCIEENVRLFIAFQMNVTEYLKFEFCFDFHNFQKKNDM